MLYSFGHKVCSPDRPGVLLYQSGRPSFTQHIMHGADSLARLQMHVSIWEASKQNVACSAEPLVSDPGNSRQANLNSFTWISLAFLWNPDSTVEEKECVLRSDCSSFASARLLGPNKHVLARLKISTGRKEDLTMC